MNALFCLFCSFVSSDMLTVLHCATLSLTSASLSSHSFQPGFAAVPLPWSFLVHILSPLFSCRLQFHCWPSCSFSFSTSQPCTVLNIFQSQDIWIIMIAPIFWQLTVGQCVQWALCPDCLFHPHQSVKQVLLVALFYRIENYSLECSTIKCRNG